MNNIKIEHSGIWAIVIMLVFITTCLYGMGVQLRIANKIADQRLDVEAKIMLVVNCSGTGGIGAYYRDTREIECGDPKAPREEIDHED